MIDHAQRKTGIGGSELAAVLGLDPNRTPLDVWAEKKGLKAPFEGNAHTLRGQRFEEAVGEYLHDRIGRDWKRSKCGLFVHPDHPYMMGNPDRMYTRKREKCGGEIKTSIVTVREEDLTDAENPKKLPWVFQSNWYMLLSGVETWHIGWMNPFWDYRHVTITYQPQLASALIAHVADWWQRHIEGNEMPEPMSAEDAAWLWPVDNGKTFEASETLVATIEQYKELKAQSRAIDANLGEIYTRIALAFGPYEKAVYAGQSIATFKTNKNGVRALRL